MTEPKPMNTWEAETSLKLNMILSMRFSDGSGDNLQVGIATKEIMAIITYELQHQQEEIVEEIEKLETHSNDWVTEDVVVKNDVLDIIKKVGEV